MKQIFNTWYQRYLSDPEAVILFLLLIAAILVITTTGYMLAPAFAGIVIAYLLEGLVGRLEALKCPHWLAVSLVYLFFMSAFVLALFILLPLLMRQLTALVTELPSTLQQGQALLAKLPELYPDFISTMQIDAWVAQLRSEAGRLGQVVLSFSLASIPSLIAVIIYLVLVPLLVFFFMLDRDKLIAWFSQYLPKQRQVMTQIWTEVNKQLANYVRGKVLEIIIVAVASYIAFALMGLQYAALLAVLVGLSVIIPFIGVTVVTIPVILVAFLQWGWSSQFAYLVVVYSVICILDANVLVPILFSEAVNLHPVAIIVAILFFGGLWGFWGVFFAIPLATLVQAILTAWPRRKTADDEAEDDAVSDSP